MAKMSCLMAYLLLHTFVELTSQPVAVVQNL